MTIVAEGPPKLCNGCQQTKPRSEFYARVTEWGVYAQSRCKSCARTRNGNANYAQQYRDRVRQDPEALAIYHDRNRERMRRQRGTPPERYRVGRLGEGGTGGDKLDPAPFAAWLATLGPDSTVIGHECGLEPSQVRKYLKCERRVTLDVVDRALLHANTLTRLDDLYPMTQPEGE